MSQSSPNSFREEITNLVVRGHTFYPQIRELENFLSWKSAHDPPRFRLNAYHYTKQEIDYYKHKKWSTYLLNIHTRILPPVINSRLSLTRKFPRPVESLTYSLICDRIGKHFLYTISLCSSPLCSACLTHETCDHIIYDCKLYQCEERENLILILTLF